MKYFVSITLLMFLAVAHHAYPDSMSNPMGKMANDLPVVLHLTPAQEMHFQSYKRDMTSGLMKDHQIAAEAARKILTPLQWDMFRKDVRSVRTHAFKTDDQVTAFVDQEAARLLLTTNRAIQLKVIALTFSHQKIQLINGFVNRLVKVLTPAQRLKLRDWQSNEIGFPAICGG